MLDHHGAHSDPLEGYRLQPQREIAQQFNAGLRHQVVVLQPDAGPQLGPIQAGLGREDVADFEHVVPFGIQVRRLVRVEADAVPQMMIERAGPILVENRLRGVEDRPAADTRLHGALDHRENFADLRAGPRLIVGRAVIHGDRAAVVGKVTLIGRPQVEDV